MTNRRKVLKGVALGSAAGAAAWKEPVVKGVVVPSHAQTSGCVGVVCSAEVVGEAGMSLLFLGGTVVAQGESAPCSGGLEGSGTVNADGSFEIMDACQEDGPPVLRVSGVIQPGCGAVSGTIDGFAFTATVNTEGSSFEDCNF